MAFRVRWVLVLVVAAVIVTALAPSSGAQVPFQPAPAPGQQQPAQPGPAPQFPQSGQPASSPADRIRSELTRRGQRVLDVGITPPSGGKPGAWYAGVAASYSQPGQTPVLRQALEVWGVIFDVARGEPPQTFMAANEVWTKYVLLVVTQVGLYSDVVTRLQSASSDAEKSQAFSAFVNRVRFSVYDLERQQFVDQKDFINRNFTR
jgi:hypothetical protein